MRRFSHRRRLGKLSMSHRAIWLKVTTYHHNIVLHNKINTRIHLEPNYRVGTYQHERCIVTLLALTDLLAIHIQWATTCSSLLKVTIPNNLLLTVTRGKFRYCRQFGSINIRLLAIGAWLTGTVRKLDMPASKDCSRAIIRQLNCFTRSYLLNALCSKLP